MPRFYTRYVLGGAGTLAAKVVNALNEIDPDHVVVGIVPVAHNSIETMAVDIIIDSQSPIVETIDRHTR